MTEKRFSVKNNWIKDNCIGKLLNIDFNTITDANLCCKLLNQIEDEKKQNGKIASKFLEENEQLKTQIKIFEKFLNENNLDIDWEIFCTVDECKKDSDDYGCKECKYLGDME